MILPLYTFREDGSSEVNLNHEQMKALEVNLKNHPTPEQLLHYIYAILYSPKYRTKFWEFLKADFPRIPIPVNDKQFRLLSSLGGKLCDLHLMRFPAIEDADITYSVVGSDRVDGIKYQDNRIWINESQYFGNISEEEWNFSIGGYQPAQKWLKDRKGSILTSKDIEHYQKIIYALGQTMVLMRRIDEIGIFNR